jgi:isopenicillin-N epimerase
VRLRDRFALDPDVTFLNHGSFGACPRSVLQAQSEIRARMEAEPVRFFLREAPAAVDAARERIAALLGARPEDLVFVRNATEAVSTVLASLALSPGDELLTTDHAYPACKYALEHYAARAGAKAVIAKAPFPLRDPEDIVGALLDALTPRTRLVLIDHVTSPTGLVVPVEAIVAALSERGVDTLVDGAHAPGMIPLDLDRLGAAYYTGNLHKWLCAPKGCAILYVRRDRQQGLHPLVISHGLRSKRPRPRLWEEFDWTGTDDLSPWICAPLALDALASMLPGGLPALQQRNRELALWARDRLCETLGIEKPAPDSMIAALVSVPLPPGQGPPPSATFDVDPLWDALIERWRIQVPIFPWPAPPARLLRIACQAYVEPEDIERLLEALRSELALG